MRRISRSVIWLMAAVMVLVFAAGSFAEEKAHERRIRLSAELVRKMAIESDAPSLADVIKSGKGQYLRNKSSETSSDDKIASED